MYCPTESILTFEKPASVFFQVAAMPLDERIGNVYVKFTGDNSREAPLNVDLPLYFYSFFITYC